jgi:hypothetical protein
MACCKGEEKQEEGGDDLSKWVVQSEVGVVNYPSVDGEAAKIVLRDKFGSDFPVRHYRHGITAVDSKWVMQFAGKHLLCVGWCSTVEGLLLLAATAKTLTVIDHHKSSLNTLIAIAKILPATARLCVTSPTSSASAKLYHLLHSKDEPLPAWLRVIDMHEMGGGGTKMNEEDRALYAALTDDLDSMDFLRRCPLTELVERGKYLLQKHRPMVARTLVSKAEYGTVEIHGTCYNIAYVDLSHDKFLNETYDAFWQVSHHPPVDFLALRVALPSNNTDFKLGRPPTSQLDLSKLAKLYQQHQRGPADLHTAARIRLPHSPKHLHNLSE